MGETLEAGGLLFNLHHLDVWLFLHGNTVWIRPWLDPLFLSLTAPPHRVVLFVTLWLLLFTLGGRRGRIAAVTLLIAVAISDQLCNGLLKHWVGRTRPCFVVPQTRLLIPGQPHSPSFPSSHAMNTFAAALVLFEAGPVLGWIGVAIAVLVSWSRVYVGVHYPSDILGGAILGAAIGWGVVRLERSILTIRFRERAGRLRHRMGRLWHRIARVRERTGRWRRRSRESP